MTQGDREFIKHSVSLIVNYIRSGNLSVTPGEVYDAIAEELERRCRAVIDPQSQRQMGNAGPFNKGGK